jgi:N-acetylmuramoyl-L-alanine amidase
MFLIANHLLTGSSEDGTAVRSETSPNCNANGSIQPRFLVFHYTACSFAAARAAFMNGNAANRVSAHLLVDLDGSVTQFVPFNKRAWHAGESFWAGLADINTYSIGIEVVNYGYLTKRADGSFVAADGSARIPADQVVEARHKNPADKHLYWQAYAPDQLRTCESLAELLKTSYGLVDAVGHDDIAPARKLDPGPAFPMSRMASRILEREAGLPGHPGLYVNAPWLNIRVGPGAHYATAGTALARRKRPANPS